MNFTLRDFIIKGLKSAVGSMADFQIIMSAVGWHEKGVLTEADLAELNALIDAKNAPQTADEGLAETVTEEGDETNED